MCEELNHEYATRECSCGETFCYACCGNQNVDEGGKYSPSFMNCPACGRDWFLDNPE